MKQTSKKLVKWIIISCIVGVSMSLMWSCAPSSSNSNQRPPSGPAITIDATRLSIQSVSVNTTYTFPTSIKALGKSGTTLALRVYLNTTNSESLATASGLPAESGDYTLDPAVYPFTEAGDQMLIYQFSDEEGNSESYAFTVTVLSADAAAGVITLENCPVGPFTEMLPLGMGSGGTVTIMWDPAVVYETTGGSTGSSAPIVTRLRSTVTPPPPPYQYYRNNECFRCFSTGYL